MKAFGSASVFWLVVVLALACALFLGSQKLQYADDAYITFRHVNNLLEHGRPAWNLSGVPVLGSTTPAYTFTLALFCKVLGIDLIDHAAFSLNVIFQFVIVMLVALIGQDLFRRALPAVLLALLVGLNSVNVFLYSQGFENAMFMAALVAGLYLVRTGCDRRSLVLASLAPLIRPEGILLSPLIWGYILVKRRFKKKLLIAYLIIPLSWVAFSTAYYGSPIPHSIHAKKMFPMTHRPYSGSEVNLINRLPEVFSGVAELWSKPAGSLLLVGSAAGGVESTTQTCRKWIMLMGLPLVVVSSIAYREWRILYFLYAPMFLIFYGWIGHTKPWYFPSFQTISTMLLFYGWIRALDLLLHTVQRHTGDWVRRWKVVPILNLARIFHE